MYSVRSIASFEGAHTDCGRKLLFQLVATSPAELAMLDFSACTWRTLICSSYWTSVHQYRLIYVVADTIPVAVPRKVIGDVAAGQRQPLDVAVLDATQQDETTLQ